MRGLLFLVVFFLVSVVSGQDVVRPDQDIRASSVVYTDSYWDDMKVPATRIRQGASQKPDFSLTDLGLLFPQDDSTEIAYMLIQLPHKWKVGSDLSPHIHYLQDESDTGFFMIKWRWTNMGDVLGDWTIDTVKYNVWTYSSGTLHQLYEFPEIPGTGKTISSMIELLLYRKDNVVSGDITVTEFDIHYETDSPGSRDEYAK